MVILRGVLEVKFTKHCTCAAEHPGEEEQESRSVLNHIGIRTQYAKGLFEEKAAATNAKQPRIVGVHLKIVSHLLCELILWSLTGNLLRHLHESDVLRSNATEVLAYNCGLCIR